MKSMTSVICSKEQKAVKEYYYSRFLRMQIQKEALNLKLSASLHLRLL